MLDGPERDVDEAGGEVGEIMTLFDRIHSADITELAEFLCKLRGSYCAGCPADGSCYLGHKGFIDFLRQEVREDMEISYLVEEEDGY